MEDKPMKFFVMLGAGIFAAVLGILAAFGSFYIVDQGEVGVTLRNGAATGIAEPGLHFKLPFIDDVVYVSGRSETLRFERVQSYSKDIQAADINIAVTLRPLVTEAQDIYAQFGGNDMMYERVVFPTVLSETKIVFGQFNAETAISNRGRLVKEVEEAIRAKLVGLPIVIESVQIENIEFSDAFEDSVEQRMLAEVEVKRLEQNAQKAKVEAEITVTQAQAQADSQIAKAKAEAEAILLRGEAEAKAIKLRAEALGQNPLLVELTQAEKWDGVLPSTMVPSDALPVIGLNKTPLDQTGQ